MVYRSHISFSFFKAAGHPSVNILCHDGFVFISTVMVVTLLFSEKV